MSIVKNIARIVAATTGLSLVGLLGAAPAMAKSGDVVVRGACSATSTYKLKIGARDRGIQTAFEVDSNVVGQTWRVNMSDNGIVVFRGTATTAAPSGSFTVRKVVIDQAGTDRIVARAKNPVTGELCVARAVLPG